MPLTMRIEYDTKLQQWVNCLTFVCDVCGQQITDGKMGNYEWFVDSETSQNKPGVYFTHKEHCSDLLGADRWEDLAAFPGFAQRNLGLTDNDVKRQMRLLDRMNSYA